MLSTILKSLRSAQPSQARQARYFCAANSQPTQYSVETPVWMKPYDAAKYEVPIKHQKVFTSKLKIIETQWICLYRPGTFPQIQNNENWLYNFGQTKTN